jgi:hypothetical protein
MITLFSSPNSRSQERGMWPLQVWYWLLFGAVQTLGLVLASFANVHANALPLLLGVILLFPGILVGFVFRLPDSVGLPLAVFINAAAWYGVARIFMRDRA